MLQTGFKVFPFMALTHSLSYSDHQGRPPPTVPPTVKSSDLLSSASRSQPTLKGLYRVHPIGDYVINPKSYEYRVSWSELPSWGGVIGQRLKATRTQRLKDRHQTLLVDALDTANTTSLTRKLCFPYYERYCLLGLRRYIRIDPRPDLDYVDHPGTRNDQRARR